MEKTIAWIIGALLGAAAVIVAFHFTIGLSWTFGLQLGILTFSFSCLMFVCICAVAQVLVKAKSWDLMDTIERIEEDLEAIKRERDNLTSEEQRARVEALNLRMMAVTNDMLERLRAAIAGKVTFEEALEQCSKS